MNWRRILLINLLNRRQRFDFDAHCLKLKDMDLYRESSHSTSSHNTDFSIARFFKNMNSSHKKVYPLYSTVLSV